MKSLPRILYVHRICMVLANLVVCVMYVQEGGADTGAGAGAADHRSC